MNRSNQTIGSSLILKKVFATNTTEAEEMGAPNQLEILLLPGFYSRIAELQSIVATNPEVQCLQVSIERLIELPVRGDFYFEREYLKIYASHWLYAVDEKHSGTLIEYSRL